MTTTTMFKTRHPLSLTAGELIAAIRAAGNGMVTVTCHGAHEGAIVVVIDHEDAPVYQKLLSAAQGATEDAIIMAICALEQGRIDDEDEAASDNDPTLPESK